MLHLLRGLVVSDKEMVLLKGSGDYYFNTSNTEPEILNNLLVPEDS